MIKWNSKFILLLLSVALFILTLIAFTSFNSSDDFTSAANLMPYSRSGDLTSFSPIRNMERVRNDLAKLILQEDITVQDSMVNIMPEMGNSTVREQLGRATWRLLHTMATRFPQKPSDLDYLSFEVFVLLLSRLYPCGNCAKHFRSLLRRQDLGLPVFKGGRKIASDYMCSLHNKVNSRLGKKQFDCSKAMAIWQCGCPDEADEESDDTTLQIKQ
ncbi:hypothetical protein MIR68_000929 [Amoeboaphelidium protococcarum]|nr:hypothetical protein MIR68_000929 [Amoeboaphelidium protococcarum]